MGLRIRRGHGQRSDLLVILMLAAMVCKIGAGLVYLGERVHAPEQTRIARSPAAYRMKFHAMSVRWTMKLFGDRRWTP
jgi:hypothetical protein